MEELLMTKMKVLARCGEELANFKMDINENSPCWYVLARKAKREFMNRVYLQLPLFDFNLEESEAILTIGYFLEICWNVWNKDGGTIEETMETAVEVMVDIINEELE